MSKQFWSNIILPAAIVLSSFLSSTKLEDAEDQRYPWRDSNNHIDIEGILIISSNLKYYERLIVHGYILVCKLNV